MKLVSDWRDVWRYYSTQVLAGLAILPVAWAELPPDVRDLLPEEWRPWALAGLAMAGLAGRVVRQVERD